MLLLNPKARQQALAFAIVMWACRAHAASPAPASIAPCLIQFSSQFAEGLDGASRLVLYNADQTYVEINSFTEGYTAAHQEIGGESHPPHQGTFSYTVDLANPAHATIAYAGGASPPANDNLYFSSANAGSLVPPGTATGNTGEFICYPRQSTNGGANFSNLLPAAPGSGAITGFVVQSGGPRWVLLRAVGATLANFGVSSAAAQPEITLYDSTGAALGRSSAWSADSNLVGGYQTMFSLAGAFPLNPGSDEGVLLIALNPGSYTVATSAGGAGSVLSEAYILPF